MSRSSRVIIFRFNSKTQWQMFLLLYGRQVCVPRKNTNVASHDTLLQITTEWKTAETWFLARLFIYQSSIVSQILDFIHCRNGYDFSFDHMTGDLLKKKRHTHKERMSWPNDSLLCKNSVKEHVKILDKAFSCSPFVIRVNLLHP